MRRQRGQWLGSKQAQDVGLGERDAGGDVVGADGDDGNPRCHGRPTGGGRTRVRVPRAALSAGRDQPTRPSPYGTLRPSRSGWISRSSTSRRMNARLAMPDPAVELGETAWVDACRTAHPATLLGRGCDGDGGVQQLRGGALTRREAARAPPTRPIPYPSDAPPPAPRQPPFPRAPPGPAARSRRTNAARPGHTDCMSSRRRLCPECRREIAVVAGRFARHDPPGARERGQLVSCPGSRRQAELGAAQPSLDGYALPVAPGQLPLF